jgi:hypothetical protein
MQHAKRDITITTITSKLTPQRIKLTNQNTCTYYSLPVLFSSSSVLPTNRNPDIYQFSPGLSSLTFHHCPPVGEHFITSLSVFPSERYSIRNVCNLYLSIC